MARRHPIANAAMPLACYIKALLHVMRLANKAAKNSLERNGRFAVCFAVLARRVFIAYDTSRSWQLAGAYTTSGWVPR